MKTVTITIDTEANVEVFVKGAKGSECERLTEAIENAIGKVDTKKHTYEYREVVRNENHNRQGR